MSTLSTANIQTKAANTPPVIKDLNGTECGQFVRAWIVFDGTSASIGTGENSFNISGVTDNGTGEYTIAFSNALPSANYVVAGMVANTDDGFSTSVAGATRGTSGVHINGTVAPTAGQFGIQTRFGSTAGSNGNADDFSRVYVVVFGG
jgi:hypothetical protein